MKKYFKRSHTMDAVTSMVFLICCLVLVFIPTGYEHLHPQDTYRAKARVLSVDNSDIRQHLIMKTGSQELIVTVLSGPYKGQEVTVVNQLMGKMGLDEVYTKGQTILTEFSVAEGGIRVAYARGLYRIEYEILLAVLFAFVLVLVGGWTGVKALLTFAFTALMLWKVMIPQFLDGRDPIVTALVVVGILTGVISFMIGGFNRKGLVAFLGSFLGLGCTCVLAKVFSRGFHVHGAVRPFAETLLYSGFYKMSLTRIFLAGIFVASSGAVMDLAMDIAASMHEIYQKHPRITRLEHIVSGMTVGRAVIGTMTTTLLLAYSGSYTFMLMFFMSQGMPLVNMFNLNYVAAEVLNTLVGSFGLVTVAPFTAIVGGLVFHKRQP
jgi:uncharacterized membrane protein